MICTAQKCAARLNAFGKPSFFVHVLLVIRINDSQTELLKQRQSRQTKNVKRQLHFSENSAATTKIDQHLKYISIYALFYNPDETNYHQRTICRCLRSIKSHWTKFASVTRRAFSLRCMTMHIWWTAYDDRAVASKNPSLNSSVWARKRSNGRRSVTKQFGVNSYVWPSGWNVNRAAKRCQSNGMHIQTECECLAKDHTAHHIYFCLSLFVLSRDKLVLLRRAWSFANEGWCWSTPFVAKAFGARFRDTRNAV